MMNSPSLDLLFAEALDHLVTQVVDGLHLCGLQCQLAHLGPLASDD